MRRAERLYELQKVDLALDAAHRRVREIDTQLADSEALRAARDADRALHDKLVHLNARVKDLELQLAALDNKIRSAEDRLYSGAIKNPKELSDLQKDAASLRRQKSSMEDVLLEAILDSEQTEQVAQAAHGELVRLEDEWRSQQAALLDERARLNGNAAAAETERAALRANVLPPDLTAYDRLRAKRHGTVVALLDDGVCGVCGVQPSANKLAHLRRDDELFSCGNCERILLEIS
jgi:hypothetical protein